MSTPSRSVFISRVSREFGKIAEDLRSTLQAVGEAGRTQVSFRQEQDTDTTLSKLSAYIHGSDIVLSLLGEYSGAYPPDPVLDDPIHPAPPSASAARTWRDLLPAGFTKLSYTQWEVILARFWKKSLFLYFGRSHTPDQAPPTADDDLPHQTQFIGWLTKERGLDREYFSLPAEIKAQVLRDLWPKWKRTALLSVAGIAAAGVAAALLIPRPDVARVESKMDAVLGKVDVLAQYIADLHRKNDDLKVRLAGSGRSYNELPLAEREKLLAESAEISVEELRRRILAGTQSADAITRARALVLKGDFDSALSITAPLKESRATDLIELCEIDAQAYDGKFQYAKALSERLKIAALIDKEKAPLAWAAARHMVAYSYEDLGDGRTSEPILREVIAVRERLLGPENPYVLGSRNNLANSLHLQGKAALAEVENRARIAIEERVLGPEHSDTLQSRSNLGKALEAQGKNAEAEAEYRSVLAVQQRVLGPEHSDTLTSRNNIATLLCSKGKNAEAEAEHRAVLAVRERVLGPEHPQTLTSRYDLANALQARGKSAEAEAEGRAVLAMHERMLGPEHPYTLCIRNFLAVLLSDQGKIIEAEAEHRAVLAMRERVLGLEHPDTLRSRFNLANVLDDQAKSDQAEAEHRAVLAVRERVLGSEHPDTLASRNNLGAALGAQGKYAEAEATFRELLAVQVQVLGSEHPDALASRSNLAVALQDQGKYAEAEAEHRAVLAVRERVLGPEHPDTLASRNNLASALTSLEKFEEALEEDRAVLAVRERVLGPEHPDTLQSQYNLAISLRDLKKWDEALAEAQRALAGRRKVLGDGHPDTKLAEELVEEIRLIKEKPTAVEGNGNGKKGREGK